MIWCQCIELGHHKSPEHPWLTLAQACRRCEGVSALLPWSLWSLGSSARRSSPPRTPRRTTRSSSSSRCPGSASPRRGRRWWPRTCPALGPLWRSLPLEPHLEDSLREGKYLHWAPTASYTDVYRCVWKNIHNTFTSFPNGRLWKKHGWYFFTVWSADQTNHF